MNTMTYLSLRRFLAVSLLGALLFVMPLSSHAVADEADQKAMSEAIEKEMKSASRARRKASEKAFELIGKVMEKVSEKEKQHFSLIYTNYNFMETVLTVQKDVGNAIDKCKENNEELKADLDQRHKEWSDVLSPLMKEAKVNLDNMLLAQDYASKKEIADIFSAIDETRGLSNNQIQKIPVTTPEACKYLIEKMDETQEQMVMLLRSTLISYPQVFSDNAAEEDQKEDKSPPAP